MLTRRRLLAGTIAAVGGPLHVEAQSPSKIWRIGWLSALSEPDPFLGAFRDELRALGYVEGRNLVLERRYANGNVATLEAHATQLAQANVALIVTSLTAVRGVRAIKGTPVVFVISGDPVEAGMVKSLARPGGNLTGVTFLSLEVAGKRVELLKQALPRLRTLAVLSNTDHPGETSERRATEVAAQRLGMSVVYVPFSQSPFGVSAELDKGLETVRRAQPDAMIVFPEGATMRSRIALAVFAASQRLPTMFGWSDYVEAGGLMSYGANQRAMHARLGVFADKILKGAKPADLPVEQPTKFELVINAKTAKALGLTIPPSLLARADQVIE